MTPFRTLAALLIIVSAPDARAQDAAAAMRALKSNCFSCHNEQKHKGGLVMTSREALLKGGESGDPALVEGAPEKSGIITALAAEADPHMPPKKQLTPAQIDLLSRWVKDGAKWDAAALVPPPSKPRAVTLGTLPASYRPALALALSPDGKRLAAGCGNEVVMLDAAAKELSVITRLAAHPDTVQSIAWSADGKRFATGAFRRVVVWNAEPLAVEREITDELTDRIAALRFTPDGQQLVIADGRITESGIVRVADVETGKLAASWTAHADTIFDLALSADGKLLATAGGDRVVKVWDFATRKELAKLEGHTAQVLTLAFDQKAGLLVSGGADQSLKAWDVKTKERIAILGKHTAAISGAVWSSAIFVATDAGGLVRYSELQSHTGGQRSESAKEKRFDSADIALHCVAASADGERVFAGSQDGRVFAWNKDGKLTGNLALTDAPPKPGHPSFLRDVLPVLSKAGCNAGACHAKPDGQNGFRLSVFSFDPQSDHREITQEARGRRVLPAAPEESLILLKATETIPHEGGERFAKNSEAYRTVESWIRGGMSYRAEGEPTLERLVVTPADQTYAKGAKQAMRVEAIYSDASRRDVTALASFESNDKEIARVTDAGAVTVGKLSGQAVIVARFMGLVVDSRINVPADRLLPAEKYAALPRRNFIDELAYAQFARLGFFPSEPCSDSEFLRRAPLDTIGALPTPEEARDFLANPDRDRLIDRLLEHPFYADYWANKWADLLRPPPDRAGIKSVYVLDQWLRGSFRENKPYDRFVREIVTAEGNTHRFGPAVIYRDKRDPADITTLFSQLFLGVRLDCAKCHHHPNEKWGQDDFYQFAAFFGPLKQKGAGISAPISAGNETFYFAGGKSVKHPVTGELLDPKAPDGPLMKTDDDPRRALADWMTDAKNPFFAQAAANRVWGAFFGRGIVEPVDDFRISNPPANPALLDALAQELVRQKFDLKELMRVILRSQLYQLSAVPNEFNAADTRNFSRSYRRRLPAEVLADAVADVTGVPNAYAGMPPGSRAMQAWSYKIASETMDAFGRPNPSSDTPCERDPRPSIVQALHLMNSRLLQEKLANKDAAARVQRLAASERTPEEIVTELYLTTYARKPTDDELKTATAAFTVEGADRRVATEDVLWALMNSAEFVFNH
ncbi:MAG: DUF1553 domain-containing protein [Chthoniobacteraceae bacterium]